MPLAALDFGRGKVLSVDEALAAAAAGKLDEWPYEVLRAVLSCQQDRGDRISTTTLTAKCDRSEFLKRKFPYTDDPKKLWPAFRGTMFHGQLEYCSYPDNIAEARYYAYVPDGSGDVLTGSPDLVSPHLGRLYDYKTCEEPPRFYPWEDQVLQVQINRWLVDHAFQVEHQGEIYTDQDDLMRFRVAEWDSLWLVYLSPKMPVPMKVTKSVQIAKTNGEGTKSARVADIWSDERVEQYIVETYHQRKEALVKGVLPPIPPAFEKQQHPLCGYCPMRGPCWDFAMQGK